MMKLSDSCCLAIGISMLLAQPYYTKAQDSAFNISTVIAQNRPVVLRSFVKYNNKKLTHVISVGDTNQVNYSYDIKQGAIFQVWRGKFLDVSKMWVDRGEDQLAVPLGTPIVLSDAPVFASLEGGTGVWPDSLAFDELTGHGYTLNKKRLPTFNYNIDGQDVKDSIDLLDNGAGLSRTLSLSQKKVNTYCRIAVGNTIEKNSRNNSYAIDGNSYSIFIDKKYKPIIRAAGNKKELLVKYPEQPVTYSIIW